MVERLKVTEVREGLWSLDEAARTVMWLMDGRDKALLLDTGFGLSDLKKTAADLVGDKELVVINSHGHIDHDSGNNQFDTVYVDRYDEHNCHQILTDADRSMLTEKFFQPLLSSGGNTEGWNPGPAGKVLTVSEDDVFDLGDRQIRVIETPGHSLGSIALFDEKNGWMFTGDTMLTWEVWGQLRESTVLSEYGRSVRKLQRMRGKVNTVFPAHWQDDRNPLNLKAYELPPEVLDIYADGIDDILTGKAETVEYEFGFEPGHPPVRCSYFRIGGIAYDPQRLGI